MTEGEEEFARHCLFSCCIGLLGIDGARCVQVYLYHGTAAV